MSKIVKTFEEFTYGDTKQSPSEKPGETTTPVREPGTPTRPRPTRRETYVPTETPSVNPDPLAELKSKLDGSKLDNGGLYYGEYKIDYNEGKYKVNGYVVGDDQQSVLDYIEKRSSYYDVDYDEIEKSGVTVSKDGEISDNFYRESKSNKKKK